MGAALVLVASIWLVVRDWFAGLVLAGTTMVGWASMGIAKFAFARPRPPGQLVHALLSEPGVDSFPSGHTALAVALVAGVVLTLRVLGRQTRWAWILGVPWVMLVAASRLYLGVHYLGDVVGSCLLASGVVLTLLGGASLGQSWWSKAVPGRPDAPLSVPARTGSPSPVR